MCNKCENFHSELFQNHHEYKLDKEKNYIFTGYCTVENHNEELEYFCKTHNQLCCGLCITKIKKKGKGQHTECDICTIEDIKEDKKNKLKQNIKTLEDLSNILDNSIKQLRLIFEKISENKEELKLKIQNIFTKIRSYINEREDKILMDLEEMYNNLYFKEDIVKESEKLPNKVKISLQKGKTIDKEWEEEYKLNNTINDCINIENNIRDINIINENINKSKESFNLKVEFIPEIQINKNNIFEEIKNFGKIYYTNIKYINFLKNIIIIKKNYFYIENIKNWINSKNSIKAKLLYRKSIDGDSYEIFHKLCDNKGPTLILIETDRGYKFGGFTSLNWDKSNKEKSDDWTFIFSLNLMEKFSRKFNNKKRSIYCSELLGPCFGNSDFGINQNMNSGWSNANGTFIKNRECTNGESYFNVIELEVFQVIIR